MAALPSSGALALGQVNLALGNSINATIALGSPQVRELYGVPTGPVSLANQGYGITAFTITGSNINLYNSAIAAGWNGTGKVVVTLLGNITSTSTGTPAIYIAGFPSAVSLNINGYTVTGCGGTGGSSCGIGVASTAGGGGGTAILVASNTNGVTINNNGIIGGGGGGGGGGSNGYTAGGGGGRAGGTVLANGGSGGGGGGGAGFGAFGIAYSAPAQGGSGSAGGRTTGGAGGAGGAAFGGAGGAGGSLGTAGGAGGAAIGGNATTAAGAGGAGGAALSGSAYTVRTGSGSWIGAIG